MQRVQRQRPASQGQASSPSARKIFNCIVDDTALVAGVKRSTRNGLRQWVKNKQIRLFVPLHALEQLNQQRSAESKHSEDVRETLEWLDEVTTKYPSNATLQGGDEVFEQWSDVQKFAVPRSLFSELDHLNLDVDTDAQHGPESDCVASHSSVNASSTATRSPPSTPSHKQNNSLVSPPTSPLKQNDPLKKPEDTVLSTPADVPVELRSLFNYILWRIHQEVDPRAALETFVFLCNDTTKTNIAKGFEVRCKRLEQLRDAITREEKESKNYQHMQSRSVELTQTMSEELTSQSPSLPKSVPIAPAAMLKPQSNLIDPDAFDRSNNITPTPRSPRNSFSRGMRGNGRGRARADMSNRPTSRGRGLGVEGAPTEPRIDPNSFERPRGGHVGRGGRRLWMPT